MRVSYATRTGDGLGLAQHIQNSGHTVQFINLTKSEELGRGILHTERNMLAVSGEVLIVDGVGLGKVADTLSGKVRVIGSCQVGDTLSQNKTYANTMLARLGLPTLHSTIDDSCERLVVGAWWDGFAFHYPFAALQTEHFLAGDLGPAISIGDCAMIPLQTKCKLFQLLKKTSRFLLTSSYRGPAFLTFLLKGGFDCVVDVTISFKHPLVSCFFEMSGFKPAKFFADLVTGFGTPKPYAPNKYAVAVVLSIPPYPHARNGHHHEILRGILQVNSKHIWLADGYLDGEGKLRISGATGRVLVVTAGGVSMREARRRVYRTLGNIHIADKQYRIDIGTRDWETRLTVIKEWGYL